MPGDELRLKHPCPGGREAWVGTGSVIRLDATEEVALEMRALVIIFSLEK